MDDPISLLDQIICVEREIALRERVYPHFIRSKKISADKARRELIAMRAVLATLQSLDKQPTGENMVG